MRAILSTILLVMACGGSGGSGSSPRALQTEKSEAPRGAQIYASECANCHGDRGEGAGRAPAVMGPGSLPLTGAGRSEFVTARDLFDYLESTMPLPKRRAGSLSDADYWAVTSYLLESNGIEIPRAGLGESNAKELRITGN